MWLVVPLLLACTSSDEDTGTVTAGPTVTGLAVAFGTEEPLAGGTVCIDDACETVADDGSFTFTDLAADSVGVFRVEAEGYRHARSAIVVGQEDLEIWGALVPDVNVSVSFSAVDQEEDLGAGHIATFVVSDPVLPNETEMPGFAVSLSPSGGVGPVYTDDFGVPTTKANGTGPMGFAAFLNVSEGTYDVTVSQAGYTCVAHPWLNVEGGSVGSSEAIVEATWLTYVLAVCTQ